MKQVNRADFDRVSAAVLREYQERIYGGKKEELKDVISVAFELLNRRLFGQRPDDTEVIMTPAAEESGCGECRTHVAGLLEDAPLVIDYTCPTCSYRWKLQRGEHGAAPDGTIQ